MPGWPRQVAYLLWPPELSMTQLMEDPDLPDIGHRKGEMLRWAVSRGYGTAMISRFTQAITGHVIAYRIPMLTEQDYRDFDAWAGTGCDRLGGGQGGMV